MRISRHFGSAPPYFRGMHLFVIGLPGSGKTTTGRFLAARWGWPFVDLDEQVATDAGLSVAELFARFGEREFRSREQAALKAAAAQAAPTVIACGGGTPLLPANRAEMARTGEALWLRPDLGALHARLEPAAERAQRPLLAGVEWEGEGRAFLEKLHAARAEHYRFARFVAAEVAAVQSELDVWALSSR